MLRREYLKAMLSATALAVGGAPFLALARRDEAQAYTSAGQPVPTVLWLSRFRTGEAGHFDYSTDDGFKGIQHIMRDSTTGRTSMPDMRLLQLLSWSQTYLAAYGFHQRFEIHCGFRTKITNDRTEGAARLSLHLEGSDGKFHACDFSTPDIPSDYMGQLTLQAHQGGVGFYPKKEFTHADTGAVGRVWRRT